MENNTGIWWREGGNFSHWYCAFLLPDTTVNQVPRKLNHIWHWTRSKALVPKTRVQSLLHVDLLRSMYRVQLSLWKNCCSFKVSASVRGALECHSLLWMCSQKSARCPRPGHRAGLGIVANTALRSNVILSAGQSHNKSARIEIHLLYSFTYQSRTIRKCWEWRKLSNPCCHPQRCLYT